MKLRTVIAIVVLLAAGAVAWVGARTFVRSRSAPEDAILEPRSPPPVTPPRDTEDIWPTQPSPQWPRNCLIEGVAIHPEQPWLAAACTSSEDERGAVLVFDAESGRLRSSTPFDTYVGWSDSANLLRWHPDGRRLATNFSTNGIALLRGAEVVGQAYPDETRDSGVRHVWVDDRMFTDTGALFEIRAGDSRFDFEDIGAPSFAEIEWNSTIGAVVGRVEQGIAAFDPIGRRVLYQAEMRDLPASYRMHWSGDGRWCARIHRATPPASDQIVIFSGDDGGQRWTVEPSAPRIDDAVWNRDGSLLVRSHEHDLRTGPSSWSHLDVVRSGRIETTIDTVARAIQASHSIPESSGVAWSPAGDGIALLLDRQEIQLRDARTGAALSTFPAPAPAIPAGLPDHYRNGHRPDFGFPGDLMWVGPGRVVRLAPHFVAFWSIDGEKIAELVVPDGA
jgi:hypothetical protein